MMKLAIIMLLTVSFTLSCSQNTRHQAEEASPVKTYLTLKTKTDSIQSKAQHRSSSLDSIAGQ
jgi:hypothetical protein